MVCVIICALFLQATTGNANAIYAKNPAMKAVQQHIVSSKTRILAATSTIAQHYRSTGDWIDSESINADADTGAGANDCDSDHTDCLGDCAANRATCEADCINSCPPDPICMDNCINPMDPESCSCLPDPLCTDSCPDLCSPDEMTCITACDDAKSSCESAQATPKLNSIPMSLIFDDISHTLTATYEDISGANIPAALQGKKIQLSPQVENGIIESWLCYTNIDKDASFWDGYTAPSPGDGSQLSYVVSGLGDFASQCRYKDSL